jgi:hypothetical protein
MIKESFSLILFYFSKINKEDKQANLVHEATRDDRLRQFERKRYVHRRM